MDATEIHAKRQETADRLVVYMLKKNLRRAIRSRPRVLYQVLDLLSISWDNPPAGESPDRVICVGGALPLAVDAHTAAAVAEMIADGELALSAEVESSNACAILVRRLPFTGTVRRIARWRPSSRQFEFNGRGRSIRMDVEPAPRKCAGRRRFATREEILAALSDDQIVAIYSDIGFRPTEGRPSETGRIDGHAIGREDRRPSAGICVAREKYRGRYRDFSGVAESLSLFDAMAKFGPYAGDWKAAADYCASLAGIVEQFDKPRTCGDLFRKCSAASRQNFPSEESTREILPPDPAQTPRTVQPDEIGGQAVLGDESRCDNLVKGYFASTSDGARLVGVTGCGSCPRCRERARREKVALYCAGATPMIACSVAMSEQGEKAYFALGYELWLGRVPEAELRSVKRRITSTSTGQFRGEYCWVRGPDDDSVLVVSSEPFNGAQPASIARACGELQEALEAVPIVLLETKQRYFGTSRGWAKPKRATGEFQLLGRPGQGSTNKRIISAFVEMGAKLFDPPDVGGGFELHIAARVPPSWSDQAFMARAGIIPVEELRTKQQAARDSSQDASEFRNSLRDSPPDLGPWLKQSRSGKPPLLFDEPRHGEGRRRGGKELAVAD